MEALCANFLEAGFCRRCFFWSAPTRGAPVRSTFWITARTTMVRRPPPRPSAPPSRRPKPRAGERCTSRPGQYVTGPIELVSNLVLHIDAGATLRFPATRLPFTRGREQGIECHYAGAADRRAEPGERHHHGPGRAHHRQRRVAQAHGPAAGLRRRSRLRLWGRLGAPSAIVGTDGNPYPRRSTRRPRRNFGPRSFAPWTARMF